MFTRNEHWKGNRCTLISEVGSNKTTLLVLALGSRLHWWHKSAVVSSLLVVSNDPLAWLKPKLLRPTPQTLIQTCNKAASIQWRGFNIHSMVILIMHYSLARVLPFLFFESRLNHADAFYSWVGNLHSYMHNEPNPEHNIILYNVTTRILYLYPVMIIMVSPWGT